MFDLNDYENAPEVPEKKIEEIEEKKEPELPIVKDEIVHKEEIKEEPKPLIENKIVSNNGIQILHEKDRLLELYSDEFKDDFNGLELLKLAYSKNLIEEFFLNSYS